MRDKHAPRLPKRRLLVCEDENVVGVSHKASPAQRNLLKPVIDLIKEEVPP